MQNKILTVLLLILLVLSLITNFFLYKIYTHMEAGSPLIDSLGQDSTYFDYEDSSAVVEKPDGDSLVAHWDFNEGEGNIANDLSGHEHNGTIIQGNWTDGIAGGGLLFRGTGYVKIGSHPDFNLQGPLTIIAWIMPSTLEELRLTILSRAAGSDKGYDLGIHTFNLLFGRMGGGTDKNKRTIIKNEALSTQGWQQVALTYDGKVGKLYINANLVREKNIGGNTPIVNSDLYIGKPADRNKMLFKGAIDEVKIFRTALSDEEIIKEYTNITNRPPPQLDEISSDGDKITETLNTEPAPTPELNISKQGLAAYYPFSRSVEDISGNENHASLQGPQLTSDRFGKNNGAFEFDGNDDIIIRKAPENMPEGIADRTISGWFRSEKRIQKSAVLFGIESSEPGKSFMLALEPYSSPESPSVFTIEGGGKNFNWKSGTGTAKFLDGKWHHMAISYDAQTVVLHIDGREVGESTDYIYETVSETISIGGHFSSRERYFNGEIDDILIYNRVLEPEEIKKLALN